MGQCRSIMFYGLETASPEDTDSEHKPGTLTTTFDQHQMHTEHSSHMAYNKKCN